MSWARDRLSPQVRGSAFELHRCTVVHRSFSLASLRSLALGARAGSRRVSDTTDFGVAQ